ncbi:MAG: hypothetical protein ACKO2Z_26900, partial [Sphaerospermopsis kisseleviana]
NASRYIEDILGENNSDQLNQLANNFTKIRNETVSPKKVREELDKLSNTLQEGIAEHINGWIMKGLIVEPSNPLPAK